MLAPPLGLGLSLCLSEVEKAHFNPVVILSPCSFSSKYAIIEPGSYSDGRNEAGISSYPAVPCMVCYGILYDPDRYESNIRGSIPQSPWERFW